MYTSGDPVVDVDDAPAGPAGADHPLPRQGVLPHVDETAVAVLLLDTDQGLVTYANPAALDLTGDRSRLPSPAARWSEAARLVPAPGEEGWADPVQVVAAGGSVAGVRAYLRGEDGRGTVYWVTGSPLLSGAGTGTGAIVALFPVHEPRGATGQDPAAPAGLLAGADGAALVRADSRAREAVDEEALREVVDAATPAGGSREVDGLTARALLASSISFSISDPRREDDPLIWVNPAFERMTGYTADEAVGRNCRFLQGPGTDRVEVGRISRALQARESVRAELLNYRSDGTAFWNSLVISPVFDGEGQLTHFVGVQTDVTARVLSSLEHERLLTAEREAREAAERAQARLDVLVRLGAVLGETLDAEEAMHRLVGTIVPELVDFCAVDVFDLGQEPTEGTSAAELIQRRRRIAVAHVDPAGVELLQQAGELDRQAPEASLVPEAVRTGRAVLVPTMDEEAYRRRAGGSEKMLDLLRTLASDSGAVLPMRARGRVIGAISMGNTRAGGRTFTDLDLGLATLVAARGALALDNARLFAAESLQRRRADALAAAGEALAGSLRTADVLEVLLDRMVPALADWAVVHVSEAASPTLRPPGTPPGLHHAISRHADPEREEELRRFLDWFQVVPGQPGPGQAWATNTPTLLPSISDTVLHSALISDEQREALTDVPLSSSIAVPLTARGVTFGALTLLRHEGEPFTTDELHFVAELGRRGALALENARLYESERTVALELQRSLLPARLPSVPDLEVAGRYLAGAAGTEVGGDWYDVVPLPDGRVAVAVGDVMGRGVRAAAVMGQLRAALRSYAVEGLGPAQILERLAAFTDILEGEHLVTCLVGMHDPDSGTVTFASAGHLPPLIIGPDGTSAFLDVDPGLPLGVPIGLDGFEGRRVAGAGYPLVAVTLEPGAVLMLFTDGLVEDRDVPLSEGLARLARTLDGALPASAEDACDSALRAMGRDSSHDDDTAVLAVRAVERVPAAPEEADGSRRRVRLDTAPAAAAAARRVVRSALVEHDLGDLVDTAELLTSELVTNAVRHGGGTVEMTLEIVEGSATVAVDDSSPQPPASPRPDGPGAVRVIEGGLGENGRGLLLVRALADDWGWHGTPAGKSVWFRLRRDPGEV